MPDQGGCDPARASPCQAGHLPGGTSASAQRQENLPLCPKAWKSLLYPQGHLFYFARKAGGGLILTVVIATSPGLNSSLAKWESQSNHHCKLSESRLSPQGCAQSQGQRCLTDRSLDGGCRGRQGDTCPSLLPPWVSGPSSRSSPRVGGQ